MEQGGALSASRRRWLAGAGTAALALAGSRALAAASPSGGPPIQVGIDGEFGLENSTSAQAVELGVRIALAQINAGGGVLGRRVEIVTRDHRSIAARGIRNIQEFAAMPGVLAVFGGRFSPVVIEELAAIKQSRLPFLAPWSAADAIVDNGSQPNYVFRLSLRDSLAMPFMMAQARTRGLSRIGLLLTNTSWGRSNLAAAQAQAQRSPLPRIVGTAWYNWQEMDLAEHYRRLVAAGAQAILLVANDDEGARLVADTARLPPDQRVPILSHWGVTGGRFFQAAGPGLQEVDFSVVQTFSFLRARKEPLARFMHTAADAGIRRVEDIVSPVGVAHAYDLMHILARAIALAGRAERDAVRDALERVPAWDGLVKNYRPPFTPARHEALGPAELMMCRYRADGVLVPIA